MTLEAEGAASDVAEKVDVAGADQSDNQQDQSIDTKEAEKAAVVEGQAEDADGSSVDGDQDGAKANDKPSAMPDNWREIAAGGDEETKKLLSRYGSIAGVAKALVEKEKLIRSGKIKQDMPDPKDDKAMAAWRKDQGIPDAPEGYVLPEAITKRLVDEDKPVLANFTEFAHAKNMPPAFVEMGTQWYVEMMERSAEDRAAKDAKLSEEADDTLRKEWSRDEYKGNMTLAKRFWESSGIDGLSEARLPDGRRLGDVPGFVQFSSDKGRSEFGDVVFSSSDAEGKHTSRKVEIETILKTDMNRYYQEGLDKEYAAILQREEKRK